MHRVTEEALLRKVNKLEVGKVKGISITLCSGEVMNINTKYTIDNLISVLIREY